MINKNLKLFLTVGTCAILLFTTACKKKIDDAYLNPNAPIKVPIETILPGVIGGFTAFNSNAGTNFGLQIDDILLGRYIQYWGSTANGENYGEMGGTIGSDNTGGIWATVYFGQGGNVNKIIEWGMEDQKWDFVGVAWAIRAWGWLELTNQYGDAILKEAFRQDLSQFHYDTQPEFYDSCRTICFRALEFLSRTDGNVNQTNLQQSDFYFNKGDISKWKKFVYGILARSYIDLSSKQIFETNHYADSAIKYASLAQTTNDDNSMATFSAKTTANGYNSYFGPTRSNIGTMRQGKYIADLMSGANPFVFTGVIDPRAWYMLGENANGTFKGVTTWLGVTEYLSGSTPTKDYPKNLWRNPTQTATTGTNDSARYVYSNEGPWPIMTASEMQFIIAEANYLNGDKTAALAAYVNGISLDFDLLTTSFTKGIPASHVITPAMKATYLADTAIVPATPDGLTLSKIMLQKYIALYGWGTHQTWIDMRKYHYIDLDPTTGIQVYAAFTPPPTSPINYLVSTNNGKYVYRCRPRYNSEYLYDIPELTRIGALETDYNTKECWFSQP
ncbi:MAG TPA: SusD/RagB family nutrient-binding outer membrane lipoprotein [Chitinophagaceae bacterium]|nr:SusD/RagB family nutrient-binding outer membrane lipoprotein [Chitinophagaceae bacterium]